MGRRANSRGNSLLEFTLVGIPMIFLLISVFEMARGMWLYNTLAGAIKDGSRYVIVHGQGCGAGTNSCTVTIADIAQRISSAGVGLDPAALNVTLVSTNSTVTCNPLNSCFSRSDRPGDVWPTDPANSPGSEISVSGVYPFRSMIAMFWPGWSSRNMFGTFNLPASSRQAVEF